MKERVILHCDLNNFFASVSLLSNVTLKDLPVAVCGSREKRHGIVLAKNEVAKKFGVKTAEAIWEAQAKCPDLIILPPDYQKYKEYSQKAHKIYERYTDLIEPFGIDECWLDVTGSTLLFGNGEEIANKIRNDIKNELKITASVGVSFNKIFAKLGSDMKKPDATTVISKENFREKIWRLPASDLLFVGRHTADKLRQNGVLTIGDITVCDDKMLERLLGKNGADLKRYALGLDNSPVTPPADDEIPKSIGKSTTPDHDLKDREQVWKILLELSDAVASSMREKGMKATTVTLHTRDTTLKVKETSKTVTVPVGSALTLAKVGMDIFDQTYNWALPLRSVGIRVSNLKGEECAFQQDFFGENVADQKTEIIESSIDKVRHKFGKEFITRGSTME